MVKKEPQEQKHKSQTKPASVVEMIRLLQSVDPKKLDKRNITSISDNNGDRILL